MRRKDREMSREFAISIVDKANFGTIALWDFENEETYSVPLSIVRIGEVLYFHSGKSGRKVDLLKNSNKVSISFVGEVEVPDKFSMDSLRGIVESGENLSILLSRVFTTQFESAIVTGKPRLIEDEKEKIEAMKKICEKYTPSKMEFFSKGVEVGLSKVNIYGIDILSVTGKRKKLDSTGEEMKFGRME